LALFLFTVTVGLAQFVRIKAHKTKNIFFMGVNIKNTPEKIRGVFEAFRFGKLTDLEGP